jgi:hypothetical protein
MYGHIGADDVLHDKFPRNPDQRLEQALDLGGSSLIWARPA